MKKTKCNVSFDFILVSCLLFQLLQFIPTVKIIQSVFFFPMPYTVFFLEFYPTKESLLTFTTSVPRIIFSYKLHTIISKALNLNY